jgi:hypothetical protein
VSCGLRVYTACSPLLKTLNKILCSCKQRWWTLKVYIFRISFINDALSSYEIVTILILLNYIPHTRTSEWFWRSPLTDQSEPSTLPAEDAAIMTSRREQLTAVMRTLRHIFRYWAGNSNGRWASSNPPPAQIFQIKGFHLRIDNIPTFPRELIMLLSMLAPLVVSVCNSNQNTGPPGGSPSISRPTPLMKIVRFNPLKTESLLNDIYKSSPYLTGNTSRHRYKAQPVNTAWGNSRCLLWEPYGTHRYTVWAECRVLVC